MRRVVIGVVVLGLACSPVPPQLVAEEPTAGAEAPEAAAPETDVLAPGEPSEGMAWEEVPFDPEGRSLRVRRSIVVRAEPSADAPPIGTLAQDMRVEWRRAVRGSGCKGAWVEVEPRGWVCTRYLEANFRAPRLSELPRVAEGALTPGVYARVVGKRARAYESPSDARWRRGGRRLRGSVTVKLVSEVRVGRRRFWRTSDREYIDARYLRLFTPSAFAGLDRDALERVGLPLAWAQSRRKRTAPVVVRAVPSAKGAAVALLPPRAVVTVEALSPDRAWARVADGAWVARSDLRVAQHTPPPQGLGEDARWLDVDLDEQVLVAYEGDTPVYATLVTTGGPGHETPEGLFRIWIKFSETDMTGRMGDDAYHVSTVPWTMFFQDDFALHTAYWHDRFGEPASHGCVNLAPQDARLLYNWSEPQVPPGWTMAYDSSTHPGSVVRVRSGAWRSPLLPMTPGGDTASCSEGGATTCPVPVAALH